MQIRGTETPVFGSPLAAWDAASSSGVRFNRYFVADLDGKLCAAARDRLLRRNASAIAVTGPAEDTVREILPQINQYGLHFALLDPYNLDDLPFSVIERLAGLKRIDLMINLCTGDLQRNLRETYLRDDNNTLRRFAPGWNPPASPGLSERQIREHFVHSSWRLSPRVPVLYHYALVVRSNSRRRHQRFPQPAPSSGHPSRRS